MSGFEGKQELYPAHLQGWRYWKYEQGRLLSVGVGGMDYLTTPWVPGMARRAIHWPMGAPNEHTVVPRMECTCGYWSFKEAERLLQKAKGYLENQDNIYFGGRINLWGKIVVGELGYRSEYAYPETLLVLYGSTIHRKAAKQLQEIYKVKLYPLLHDVLWGRMAFDVAGLPPRGASPS